MSVAQLPTTASAHLYQWSDRAVHSTRTRLEAGLVRYDAWFLVFTAVILGMGATLLAGMAVWCVVRQGKRFSGEWSFRDFGLKVRLQCV